MKPTKKNIIIIGVTVGISVVIAIIVATVLAVGGGDTAPTSDASPSPTAGGSHIDGNGPSPGVDVSLPTLNPAETEPDSDAAADEPAPLVIEVGGGPEPTPGDNTDNGPAGPTVKPAEKPVKPQNPNPPSSGNSGNSGGSGGGIAIGGDAPAQGPYKCGVKKHNCNGPETHAFISNLELQGCSRCKSNSCKSFYGTDKWGNAGLFPNLCPKYDKKKDPLYYCQDCGKKTGDGKKNTCLRLVNAAKCPECGDKVPAWTCHTCK
jgi:hypothetical protein